MAKDLTEKNEQDKLRGNVSIFIPITSLYELDKNFSQEEKGHLLTSQEKLKEKKYFFLGELALAYEKNTKDFLNKDELAALEKVMSVHGFSFDLIQHYQIRENLNRLRNDRQAGKPGYGRRDAILDYMIDNFGSDDIKKGLLLTSSKGVEEGFLKLEFRLSAETSRDITNSNISSDELSLMFRKTSTRALVRPLLQSLDAHMPTDKAVDILETNLPSVLLVHDDFLSVSIPVSPLIEGFLKSAQSNRGEIDISLAKEANIAILCALKVHGLNK